MKPAPFHYHAPETLDAAVDLLAGLDDAKVLAGGQSLVPLLNMRLAIAEDLVDLRRLGELAGIRREGDSVWIGASTTQAVIERDPTVAGAAPLLARALPFVGHVQIRNRGTIGGSLAHADPAAELPAVALTLDATIEARSSRGLRTIGAEEFFTGVFSTALADDEVLTAVRFPVWDGRCGYAVEEVARRHGDFAIAGACVAVRLADDDTVRTCAIGMLGLGSRPARAAAAEVAATGASASTVDAAELGRQAVADLTTIPSDLNGSAEYRARIGATFVARAWARAVEDARNG